MIERGLSGRKYRFTKQTITLTALFLLILTPNFFTLCYSVDLRGHWVMSLAYVFTVLLIWLLVYYFLPKRLFLCLGFLSLLFSPLEMGTVMSLGVPLNTGITEAILNTNYEEAKEQVAAHLGLASLLIVLLLLFLLLGFLLQDKRKPPKMKWILAISFIAINLLVFVKMFRLIASNPSFSDKLDTAWRTTTLKYNKIYPVSLIINLADVYSMHQKSKRLNQQLKDFSFGAHQSPKYDKCQIIVLVIGETARFGNFHLNGYKRQTTPELEQMPHLISFTNVFSCGNLTNISIPQIITRATPENFDLQFKEKTVVDALSEAGFATAWISSQKMSTPIIQRLQKVVTFAYFPSVAFGDNGYYDAMLLPKIKYYLNHYHNKKKFIVVHTMGSHYRYGSRYPRKFEVFKPVPASGGLESLEVSPKERQKLVNAYDNSILYTDYFLAHLIKLVDSMHTSSILVYLSDHGESLYDNGGARVFHGNENPTRQEYHIPYLVWYSAQYLQSFPKKVQALKENKNKPAMSTATFYTILDMGNVKYNNSNSEIKKSLADSLYQPPSDRVLLNTAHNLIHVQ